MGDARAPVETPKLGVPDVEWPRAIAVKALNILGNKQWISVPGLTITAVDPTYQIAATLSMVAKGTGRFRARFVGYIGNSGGATHQFFGGVSHGTGVLTNDYVAFPLNVPPSVESAQATIALIFDFPTGAGFTAAVGSTTDINMLVSADAASDLVLFTRAAQFEVEEY
jgi:hypothetical protein